MKILYVLPSFYCCGGNRIAIEHCNGLAKRGYDVHIAVLNNKYSLDWIKLNNITIHYGIDDLLLDSQIVVATYFETFYNIINTQFKKAKLFYFVQQLENRFFQNGDSQKKAIQTYELSKQHNVKIITEAKWIKDELKRLYNIDAVYVPNCQELPEIKKVEIKTSKVKVLIEGNCETPNKGVQDAWEAIKDLDCYKVLLTNSPKNMIPSNYKFDEMFCSVPWETALGVIKSCDIIVKPSYFEGSPTPLMEAWELETAVVTTNCTGWDEYGIEGINCLVCNIGDVKTMKNKIQKLINIKKNDDLEWNRFITNGLEIAKNKFVGWDKSIKLLEDIFYIHPRTNNGLISVIMPTYNRRHLIQKSIQSVLNQTIKNWELVVINDGGEDVSDLLPADTIYINKQNGGLSSALNYGIKLCHGDFIALLDDDDLWEPNHLELLSKNIEDCDIVYANCKRIKEDGTILVNYNLKYDREEILYYRNLIPTCSVMFRKLVWSTVNGFDTKLTTHMDWDFWKKATINSFDFKHIDVYTSFYVEHGKNMMLEKDPQIEKDILDVMNRYINL